MTHKMKVKKNQGNKSNLNKEIAIIIKKRRRIRREKKWRIAKVS